MTIQLVPTGLHSYSRGVFFSSLYLWLFPFIFIRCFERTLYLNELLPTTVARNLLARYLQHWSRKSNLQLGYNSCIQCEKSCGILNHVLKLCNFCDKVGKFTLGGTFGKVFAKQNGGKYKQWRNCVYVKKKNEGVSLKNLERRRNKKIIWLVGKGRSLV